MERIDIENFSIVLVTETLRHSLKINVRTVSSD